jgi:hypothetical protein
MRLNLKMDTALRGDHTAPAERQLVSSEGVAHSK